MDLIRIFFDSNWNLHAFLNKWVLAALLLCVVLWLVYMICSKRVSGRSFEIDEAEIGIGNQKIKIKPNYEDVQIAYKLWVELSTRKIGLPIDFDNDVIVEVYNSWYEFFKLTRELIKDIPASKLRKNESTKRVVRTAIDVLNEGLRPHLTLWQARFRRWYQAELQKQENKQSSPQDLQRLYPNYDQLTANMKNINEKLIKYRETLRLIAMGS